MMKKDFTSEDLSVLENAITPEEQAALNEAFASALWRYDWPVNSTPFARPCWHFFIAGSKRELLECCEEELEANERWRFLLGIWTRLSAVHMKGVRLIGVYANGQCFGQDTPIHRDNLPSQVVSQSLMVKCHTVRSPPPWIAIDFASPLHSRQSVRI